MEGGGAERQLQLLSSGLKGLGNDVDILYFQRPTSEDIMKAGVCYHYHPLASNYSPKLLSIIKKVVQSVQPDIVQTWISQVDIATGVLKYFDDFKWVIRESSNKAARKQTLKLKLRKKLAKRADAIIANSKIGLEYWLANTPGQKLGVIPNGFLSKPALTRTYQDGLKLLSVGRLISSKNHVGSLQFLNEIRKVTSATLTIVGSGADQESIERQVKQMDLGGVVTIKPFMPQDLLAREYENANVFLSLSEQEGMPNTVVEAANYSLPLILSPIPAHQELFNSNEVIYSGDSQFEALSENIAQMGQSDWQKLARSSRAAVQKFTIDNMASQYLNLYKEII